jgi:urease accessory protein
MVDAPPVTTDTSPDPDHPGPADLPTRPALIMLTDGRFPSGGHAYSAGMEQAVTWGDVIDLPTAAAFAAGRAATSSAGAAQTTSAAATVVTAAAAVDAATVAGRLDRLDAEADARMASPAARAVSRQQGRRWLRAVRGVWPVPLAGLSDTGIEGVDRHAWVVVGAVTALLGLSPAEGATVALYDLVGTPLWAAVRLLGLDPVATTGVLSRLVAEYEPSVRRTAGAAAAETTRALSAPGPSIDWSWISWSTAPMADLASEAHLRREERLFAS